MDKIIVKLKNYETFEFEKMDFEQVWKDLAELDYKNEGLHILHFKNLIVPLEEIMYIRKEEEEQWKKNT